MTALAWNQSTWAIWPYLAVTGGLTALLADAQKGMALHFSRQTVEQFFTHWLEDAVKGTAAAGRTATRHPA